VLPISLRHLKGETVIFTFNTEDCNDKEGLTGHLWLHPIMAGGVVAFVEYKNQKGYKR
jgi:hypothetical protein